LQKIIQKTLWSVRRFSAIFSRSLAHPDTVFELLLLFWILQNIRVFTIHTQAKKKKTISIKEARVEIGHFPLLYH
jgi:uncharacterized membrane protein